MNLVQLQESGFYLNKKYHNFDCILTINLE